MKPTSTTALFLFTWLFSIFFHHSYAQVTFSSPGETFQEDFNDFRGEGFAPSPASDQLDSEKWRITGLSDGDMEFGVVADTSDFAMGESDDHTGPGGIYAYDVASGDYSLGVQPTGSGFTPGAITLKMVNNTGTTIRSITTKYDVYFMDNQDRINSFNFRYFRDDDTYTDVPGFDFQTQNPADDPNDNWDKIKRDSFLLDLNWKHEDTMYLQWYGDELSNGSGGRDQFALNNLEISAVEHDDNTMIDAPSQQIGNTTISTSANNPDGDSLEVFRWDVIDQGGDGIPTFIEEAVFEKGSQNTASWEEYIHSACIKAGNKCYEPDVLNFDNDELKLSYQHDFPFAYDDSATDMSLFIKLEENVTDEAVFQFKIPDTDHDFVASSKGTGFDNSFSQSIVSSEITIDVDADRLVFAEIPNSIRVDKDFELTIHAVDEFGNRDKSKSSGISFSIIQGSGNFTGLSGGYLQNGEKEVSAVSYDTDDELQLEVTDDMSVLSSDETHLINSSTMELEDDFTGFDSEWQGDEDSFAVLNDATIPGGNASTSGNFLASDENRKNLVLTQPSETIDQWKFSLATPDFNPSSSNYFGVILMADKQPQGTYDNGDWSGYYLRIGNTSSPNYLELYRMDKGNSVFIDSFITENDFADGGLKNGINIHLSRDSDGNFSLKYSAGFEYASEPKKDGGTIHDNTYFQSAYFGVFTDFNNKSADRRIYMDNLEGWNNNVDYEWVGGTEGDGNENDFHPPLDETAPSDRLIFDKNDKVTLHGGWDRQGFNMLIKDGTHLVIEYGNEQTQPVLGGGREQALKIASGATMQFAGEDSVEMAVAKDAVMAVEGTIILGDDELSNVPHRLIGYGEETIVFKDGSALIPEGITGSAFEDGVDGSVIFEDGSEYRNQTGANPFDQAIFKENSTFVQERGLAPSFSGRTYGNFELNHSSGVSISNSGEVTIQGDIIVTDGTLHFDDEQPIKLGGNIEVAAEDSFIYEPSASDPSIISLEGDEAQHIKGDGTVQVGEHGELAIDQSHGLVLENDLEIYGTLNFNSGNARLKNGDLFIHKDGNLTGADINKPVETGPDENYTGSLKMFVAEQDSVVFPVQVEGSGTFSPVGIQTNPVDEYFSVRIFDYVYKHGTTGDIIDEHDHTLQQTWIVEPDNGTPDADLTFQWEGSQEPVALDNTNLYIAGNDDESSSEWNELTAAGSPDGSDPYSLTVSSNNDYPAFTIGDESAPLPVDWLSFEAEKTEPGKVHLYWETATEINNKGFSVLRSLDGKEWTEIEFVEGAGYSPVKRSYSVYDENFNRAADYVFYKIRQIDFDGTTDDSPIRAVRLENDEQLFQIRPNPIEQGQNVTILGPEALFADSEAYILSLNGQVIQTPQIKEIPVANEYRLKTQSLLPGGYILLIRSENITERKKLLVR